MFCAKKRNPELVMKNVVVIVRLRMLLALEKTLAIYLSLFFYWTSCCHKYKEKPLCAIL